MDLCVHSTTASEESEVVVRYVEEGVVVQAIVDVVLTLVSTLADFVDVGLRFFVERTVVEGVVVDGDTQLQGKAPGRIWAV